MTSRTVTVDLPGGADLVPDAVLDPLRPDADLDPGAADLPVDPGEGVRDQATPTRRTSATSTTSSRPTWPPRPARSSRCSSATRASRGSTRSPSTTPVRRSTPTSRVTPHVTNAQAQTCNTALGQATFAALRLPVLDGSRAACEWGSDPDSLQPGTFGPSKMPSLIRRDYVTNCNDSYWLSNPAQPLTGFATIIGDEGTARTLRTRLGLIMTKEIADVRGFDRQVMQDMVFNNRQYAGELTRTAAVSMCRAFPGGQAPQLLGSGRGRAPPATCSPPGPAGTTSTPRARCCSAGSGPAPPPPRPPASGRCRSARADPVRTPNTLDTANPKVQQALGDAIRDLQGAGIPLDGAAARLPVRHPQRGAHPDPRRPRHAGPVQRAQHHVGREPGVPDGQPRLLVRAVGGLRRRRLPGRGDDPHLQPVHRPDLALVRRPDAPVQRQDLGEGPVLRRGRGGQPGAAGERGGRRRGARRRWCRRRRTPCCSRWPPSSAPACGSGGAVSRGEAAHGFAAARSGDHQGGPDPGTVR